MAVYYKNIPITYEINVARRFEGLKLVLFVTFRVVLKTIARISDHVIIVIK